MEAPTMLREKAEVAIEADATELLSDFELTPLVATAAVAVAIAVWGDDTADGSVGASDKF